MNKPHLLNPRKSLVGIFRFSVAGFLAALVLFLVASPLAQNIENNNLVESVLLSLVLISAVLAVGHRRWVLWVALVLLAPALVGNWVNHFRPENILKDLYLGCSLLFVLFVILQLMHFILCAPRVNSEVLCAGIATYLLLGMLWAFAYALVASLQPPTAHDPGAFVFSVPGPTESSHLMKGITALYFSYITLTTVGYGDITPVSNVARMLSAAEAMTGTLFMAVLISRLVSMYSSQSPQEPGKKSSDTHS